MAEQAVQTVQRVAELAVNGDDDGDFRDLVARRRSRSRRGVAFSAAMAAPASGRVAGEAEPLEKCLARTSFQNRVVINPVIVGFQRRGHHVGIVGERPAVAGRARRTDHPLRGRASSSLAAEFMP